MKNRLLALLEEKQIKDVAVVKIKKKDKEGKESIEDLKREIPAFRPVTPVLSQKIRGTSLNPLEHPVMRAIVSMAGKLSGFRYQVSVKARSKTKPTTKTRSHKEIMEKVLRYLGLV